jgi:hypothetical protein
MKTSYTKLLNEYEEGRITSTGFVVELLNSVNHDELKEALEMLPSDLVDRVRDFVESYRSDMKVYGGSPPDPSFVKLARELLTKTVKLT